MECVNFDKQFERFAAQWMRENADKYGNNVDRMEARMPDVYLRWLNRPARWLDGAAPGTYFARFSDPRMLLEWMMDYERTRVPVPEQLLERVAEVPDAEAALMEALLAVDTPLASRMVIVNLLREMSSCAPMAYYIEWIARRKVDDDLADLAAEALTGMGGQVVPALLDAVDSANPAGQETFLEVLCNFPGDERITQLALRLFENREGCCALYASYLGKLGDPRAVEPMQKAVRRRGINYLDYIELRNAIEALGGDAPTGLDFTGDPYYESLRGMEGAL
jgi:hypothetical protein